MRLLLFFIIGIFSIHSYGLAYAISFGNEKEPPVKNPIIQIDSTLELTMTANDSSQTAAVEKIKQAENPTIEIIGDGRMNNLLYQHLYKDQLPNPKK